MRSLGNWRRSLSRFLFFLYFGRTIAGELNRRPDLVDSPVRLWLTYIALVIAATVAIGDGIAFLSAFLLGQVTIRFLLDSLVLLVLAGGVFTYYFADLRRGAER